MTTIDEVYPSKYMKATDIDGSDLIVTITKTSIESLGLGDRSERKIVLHFNELEKCLPLNKTNATTIGEMYGKRIETWIGKRLALYPAEVAYQGKMMMSIRVRTKPPAEPGYDPVSEGPDLFNN